MITIIFAPPRTGKTCFLTHVLNCYAFDRARFRLMQDEIAIKNANGWNLTCPRHCVSSNYDITFKKFGYHNRFNRLINPYRLGFYNEDVKVHFNFPYEVIGITEAQKYFNSRKSAHYPDWQSRWFEQHGHNNLEIWLDVQRPNLIDVNIRELAQFIEIVSLDIKCTKQGQVKALIWTIRKIENSALFDKYMSSGKQDKSCYTEEKVTANYNVFELYDSQSCKPKFYAGHFEEDFDYKESKPISQDVDGYKEYLQFCDDELPKYFYGRKKVK